ncbi:MAG: hypothetical protein QNJ54_14245 [Prochloraceae cyanobacterium]|nr:hypothetical protein [Prochloraceae cyanobacterium]
MGLVKFQGNAVMPLCDLYRQYLRNRLATERDLKVVEADSDAKALIEPVSNNKQKTTLKYRGREILKENQPPSSSDSHKPHKLKYRGQYYSK